MGTTQRLLSGPSFPNQGASLAAVKAVCASVRSPVVAEHHPAEQGKRGRVGRVRYVCHPRCGADHSLPLERLTAQHASGRGSHRRRGRRLTRERQPDGVPLATPALEADDLSGFPGTLAGSRTWERRGGRGRATDGEGTRRRAEAIASEAEQWRAIGTGPQPAHGLLTRLADAGRTARNSHQWGRAEDQGR